MVAPFEPGPPETNTAVAPLLFFLSVTLMAVMVRASRLFCEDNKAIEMEKKWERYQLYTQIA